MPKNYKNNSILVVAAHPDDEVLGCGGTISLHVNNGDKVSIVFFSDGVTSRNNTNSSFVNARKNAGITACNRLGVKNIKFLDMPDNKLDTIPFLDLVQKLEKIIDEVNPLVVYTHFSGDLNIDHRIVHQVVMTACRPQPNYCVREIYSFEILSSTGWTSPVSKPCFSPNKYIDISQTLEDKLYALDAYKDELREFPHSRSAKSVEYLAKYRGSSVGLIAAEAFMVERILN